MTAAFTNNALLRLVSPTQWVTSTVRLLIWRYLFILLVQPTNPCFPSSKASSFLRGSDPTSRRSGDSSTQRTTKTNSFGIKKLSNLVLLPGQTWVSNIHTIYAPII
ncbi:hypothetical protein YC2023_076575 [Brassica napus]